MYEETIQKAREDFVARFGARGRTALFVDDGELILRLRIGRLTYEMLTSVPSEEVAFGSLFDAFESTLP